MPSIIPADATTATSFPVVIGHPAETPPRTWEALMREEPRLALLEASARMYSRHRRGRRWHAYEQLKRDASRLVGWGCKRPELASSKVYELVIGHLVDVLENRR